MYVVVPDLLLFKKKMYEWINQTIEHTNLDFICFCPLVFCHAGKLVAEKKQNKIMLLLVRQPERTFQII